jgi:hypothetical protein
VFWAPPNIYFQGLLTGCAVACRGALTASSSTSLAGAQGHLLALLCLLCCAGAAVPLALLALPYLLALLPACLPACACAVCCAAVLLALTDCCAAGAD